MRTSAREGSALIRDSRAPAANRGRTAKIPEDIPARGWWDISWRVMKRLGTDNVTLVAGGLAMYTLLSVFPGLTAALSIYGLFASPETVIAQMKAFSGVLPPGVWNIFNTQLQTLARHQNSTLSIAAGITLLIALWSARSAMSALMTATNIAYGEKEKRNYFVQVLVSLALTVGAMSAFLLMLTLGVAIPVTLKVLGTRPWVQWIVDGVQWVLVWGFSVVGLSAIYRFGPSREPARWHWITWGSGIAAALWLGGSAIFALYVGDFANYGKTYGALGGVIALLMWFYVSSIFVVLGAEINAEMERQTVKDTTGGAPEPLGERGAFAADTVGPQANESSKEDDQERGIQGR
jgi:membrane protein